MDIHLHHSDQTGSRPMTEELYTKCDELYRSGDIGIELLPENVRPVVLLASRTYQRIQDEVRARDYDVFNERIRVPSRQKLKLAVEHIGFKMTLQMVVAEMLLVTAFALDKVTTPLCLLVGTWQLCRRAEVPTPPY